MLILYRARSRPAPRRPQDAVQLPEDVVRHERLIGRAHTRAGGPIEHPLRQLERPT
jgi:hypothetical protein